MSDFALSALFLFLGGLAAAITALVAAKLQHRSAQDQEWQRTRTDRRIAALKTVEAASQIVDRRLYRQRKFLWAMQRGDPAAVELARKEYSEIVTEWMDNLGRTKASLWAEFDRWTMISFETDLHDEFARIGRHLEGACRAGGAHQLSNEEHDLNRLGRTAYEFMNRLIQRINEEEIAGLVGRDAVTVENWDNLSSTFLLSRLLGLGQKT